MEIVSKNIIINIFNGLNIFHVHALCICKKNLESNSIFDFISARVQRNTWYVAHLSRETVLGIPMHAQKRSTPP